MRPTFLDAHLVSTNPKHLVCETVCTFFLERGARTEGPRVHRNRQGEKPRQITSGVSNLFEHARHGDGTIYCVSSRRWQNRWRQTFAASVDAERSSLSHHAEQERRSTIGAYDPSKQSIEGSERVLPPESTQHHHAAEQATIQEVR